MPCSDESMRYTRVCWPMYQNITFYGCDLATSDYTFCMAHRAVTSKTSVTSIATHCATSISINARTTTAPCASARSSCERAPVDRVCQCGAGNPPIVPLPSTSNLASRWAPLATAFLNTVDLSSLLKLFGDVSASLGFHALPLAEYREDTRGTVGQWQSRRFARAIRIIGSRITRNETTVRSILSIEWRLPVPHPIDGPTSEA